jgi:hypothetical protein
VSVSLTVTVSVTVTATVTVTLIAMSFFIGRGRSVLPRLPNRVGAVALSLHARMHPPLFAVIVNQNHAG